MHARIQITMQMRRSNSSISLGFRGREREVMSMPRFDAAARMRESAASLGWTTVNGSINPSS
jgi:hypothetical protein